MNHLVRLQPITKVLSIVVLLHLSVFGCTKLIQRPGTPSLPVVTTYELRLAEAEQAWQQQAYLRAAYLFRTLAEQQSGTLRDILLLRSADADMLATNKNVQQIQNTLATLQQADFSGDEALLMQVLQAEMAVLAGTQAALPWRLDTTVFPSETADPALKLRFYRAILDLQPPLLLRAEALSGLDTLLVDTAERMPIQLELLRTLQQLGTTRLHHLSVTEPLQGWVQLALLSQPFSADLPGFQQVLPDWQAQYPAHPALIEPLIAAWAEWFPTLDMPRQVAILLPKTGRYAPLAQALHQGIMLSLNALPAGQRPSVQLYDTMEGLEIAALYQQAVADGAEWVIGPLRKQAVTDLAQLVELPVPVLALNQITTGLPIPLNLLMFGLNPEDEAQQAAERIWLDGKRQPVVLVPENAWGQRLLHAFQARWAMLSGEEDLVSGQYDPKSYDHSQSITKLLLIDQSQQRHSQLQTLLRRTLEFSPRRRLDVDAFFVAVRGAQAQGFAPQLKFHLAGDLPLYTTSHIWSGQLSKHQLTDMRGIFVPDIPMLVNDDTLKAVLNPIPDWQLGWVRLYAMGMDALNILPHLDRLRADPTAMWDGQTGLLSLSQTQRLVRRLPWIQLDEPIRLIAPAMPPQAVLTDEALYAP